MEFRKMVTITLYSRQQKRHWCIEQSFGLCGRGTGWESKLNLGFFVQVILRMMVLLTEIKPQEEKQLCRGFNSNLEDICVFPEHHTIPSAAFLLATASFLTLGYRYYQHHCLLTQRIPRRGSWNELSQIAYLIKLVFKVVVGGFFFFLTWIFF